ncbi:MAG: GntR family transcriptional regulator, partial [Acidimicrobiales bacterium]
MARSSAASIGARIEADIAAGVVHPGERLTPVRKLAEELAVSPATVAAAYRALRERGIVVGRGRQGSMVAPAVRPPMSQVVPLPDGVIDAMRGSPDRRLLPDLGPALAAAAAQPQVEHCDSLPDSSPAKTAHMLFSN